MANIINIETSSKVCSVALSIDNCLEQQLEDHSGMKHSTKLAPFVEECMSTLRRRELPLDAVSVSIGPGSYTGLRIGLSLAKGLAFSQNAKLIGVSTLQILAVKAMFRSFEWTSEEILIPMIDARRMEVYTAAYDFSLNEILSPQPMILNEDSFADILQNKRAIFIGDAVEKAQSVISSPNAIWIEPVFPMAKDMIALSEKYYREEKFLDIAYSVPEYLKEYEAKQSANKVLGN